MLIVLLAARLRDTCYFPASNLFQPVAVDLFQQRTRGLHLREERGK